MISMDKLKRTGQVTLPSLFTIANIAFGFFAILAAIEKEFVRAGWFIIAAMLMDSLDGRIARLGPAETKFGIEMDSLADFLSFGVAPAVIMYLFHLKDYGFWGYPVAFIYAMCGALRLARFNVMSHEGKGSRQGFTGLPIPGAAGIIAAFVITYSLIEMNDQPRSLHFVSSQMPLFYNLIPFMMLGLGFLMVSTIPYAAFKQGNIFKPKTLGGLVFAVFLVFMVIKYPQDAVFLVFFFYVLSGIVAWFWQTVKKLARSGKKSVPSEPQPSGQPPL